MSFASGSGRQSGGERAVGDANAHVSDVELAYARHDAHCKGVVTTEVARRSARRERQLTRPFEHETRDELFDRAHDELECARVGRLVGVEHRQTRAACFGLAHAQSDHHTLGARFSRCRRHHFSALLPR
jgi:hypothetical protein